MQARQERAASFASSKEATAASSFCAENKEIDDNQFLVQNENKTGSKCVMIVNPKLEALRMQIRLLEGHNLETTRQARIVPLDDPLLNACLPRGGLETGALHEFCAAAAESESAPAATAFMTAVAARILQSRDGFLLWAASQADCYPPGLARLGLDISRIVWIACLSDAEVLGVMEEALHSRALAAVLGEAGALSLKMGRRLDAAARQSGTAALLLRRHRARPSNAAGLPSGAAATRWRAGAAPGSWRQARDASGAEAPGLGLPRWQLDLEYCRNGKTASWIVEASDGTESNECKAGHVRVVAELCDDARPLERTRAGQPARAFRSG